MRVRRDDQVAGLTTDRARSEVMLRRALVVSGTPRANTLQAEDVIAAIKHSKLLTICQHFFEADLTLSIILFVESLMRLGNLGMVGLVFVAELALVSIPAAIGLEESA